MQTPYLRMDDSDPVRPLDREVTTVGRGPGVDIILDHPTVSRLHAELVRRGPYVYVADLGLSRNGTRVNGRPVSRRVLCEGDVISFGAARCRIGGLAASGTDDADQRTAPELTRRERDVVQALCRTAASGVAFPVPASAAQIAAELVVTEAAVKQHLLRLYAKFRIGEGPDRRVRLANEIVAQGLAGGAPGAVPRPFIVPGRGGAAPDEGGSEQDEGGSEQPV